MKFIHKVTIRKPNLHFRLYHFIIPPLDESRGYIGILMSVRHTFGFRIIIKVPLNQIFKLSHIAMYHKIQVKFDYGVFHIYRSWVVALFLLENRDFLGFRMIFKVWLDQICSNFNTMLWTIKYRLSSIMVYFTFTVPELWPFFS